MAPPRTTTVEISTPLLEELRKLYPGKSDRQILENIVRAYLAGRRARAS